MISSYRFLQSQHFLNRADELAPFGIILKKEALVFAN